MTTQIYDNIVHLLHNNSKNMYKNAIQAKGCPYVLKIDSTSASFRPVREIKTAVETLAGTSLTDHIAAAFESFCRTP